MLATYFFRPQRHRKNINMQTGTFPEILTAAQEYVAALLNDQLTSNHLYHDLQHTRRVCQMARELGAAEGLGEEDLEALELAALFHDTGFTKTYEGHEAISKQLAAQFLSTQAYPEERLAQVLDLIEVTYPPKVPQTLPEKVLCDADLSNLGHTAYFDYLQSLRHEWRFFLNQEYTNEEWFALNYKFVKKHTFYTEAAQQRLGEQWNANRKQLKKLRDSYREAPAKQDKEQALPGVISNNKSAQTMFKTSLRNHLDLSALADNKANIMLSVNALIITIATPLAASYVRHNTFALIPAILLLATCLASMIFATLATRPIKMKGETSSHDIEQSKSNLFFFGNFFRMDYERYEHGMLEVVRDNQKLDSSIMRDLYFLGKSLGRKYHQLRICYTIFMWGIIITVFAFALTYNLASN